MFSFSISFVTPRPQPSVSGRYVWRDLYRPDRPNTSLSCAPFPHLWALGINFLVDHPSSNRSEPSKLNFEVSCKWAPEKE